MLFATQNREDASLVRAVLGGRTEQFEVLVRRYQGLVYGAIVAQVSAPEDVEDLAQQTFLEAYVHLRGLEEPRFFALWLRRIALNRAADFLRTAAARRRREVCAPAVVPLPGRTVEEEETRTQVWAAIQRLPEALREAVLLHYWEERSRQEVARFLGITLDGVKQRLRRARQALRDQLAEEPEDELDRRIRKVVGERRPGKEFTRKVMAGLPLVWLRPLPAGTKLMAWSRTSWGLGLGALALVGAFLGSTLGHLRGLWGEAPHAPAALRVRLASPEERLRLLEEMRWPEETGNGAAPRSLFGSPPLDTAARERARQALGRGWGARLVWDFRQDDEGWRVSDGLTASARHFLRTQAVNGVLRVELGEYRPGRVPDVLFISPEIGYDAALFDRVTLRARLVHDHSRAGSLRLQWTTPLNRLFPGADPRRFRPLSEAEQGEVRQAAAEGRKLPAVQSRFATGQERVTLGTDWQEVVIEPVGERTAARLRPGETGDPPERCWAGELVDLRISLLLAPSALPRDAGPEGWPRVLEVDRIALSRGGQARQEVLDGPPALHGVYGGEWLGDGRFYPLGDPGVRRPVPADLDGDGDLDLVVTCLETNAEFQMRTGLVTALNDGRGRFARGSVREVEAWGERIGHLALHAADLDGDGRADLVLGQGLDTRILRNRGAGVFAEAAAWQHEVLVGAADLDGDGWTDVVTVPHDSSIHARPYGEQDWRLVLRRGGPAGFRPGVAVAPPGPGWCPFALGEFGGAPGAELVWRRAAADGTGAQLLVWSGLHDGTWRRSARFAYARAPGTAQYWLSAEPLYLGDVDADGRWDLGLPRGTFWEEVLGPAGLGLELLAPVGGRDDGGEVAVRPVVMAAAAPADEGGRPVPRWSAGRPWLPRYVHLGRWVDTAPALQPQVQDLDGDGVADPLFVDANYRRGSALLVLRGQRGAVPVEEGRYGLPEGHQAWACADFTGDEAPDVVVAVDGPHQAGIYLLPNMAGRSVWQAAAW
ncbi:MAG: sigma-70 family RNA polymerase sigma factor [Candidatus Latescibacterota bacterium]